MYILAAFYSIDSVRGAHPRPAESVNEGSDGGEGARLSARYFRGTTYARARFELPLTLLGISKQTVFEPAPAS